MKNLRRDDKGRVLKKVKGRWRVDRIRTAKEIKKLVKLPAKGKGRDKAMDAFLNYYHGQTRAGKVPVTLKSGKILKLARSFGSVPPAGSKVAFLPRKFAGKKIRFKGNVPQIVGKNSVSEIYFLDFVNEALIDELQSLLDDNTTDQDLKEALVPYVATFINSLPNGANYIITLATGDYARGSTFSKKALGDKILNLIISFIRSKGPDDLAEFVVAVTAQFTGKSAKNRLR